MFTMFCQGRLSFDEVVARRGIRAILRLLGS
jgi:hypothetical protein